MQLLLSASLFCLHDKTGIIALSKRSTHSALTKKYCAGTVVSDGNTTVPGTVPWYCMITIFMYCRKYNTWSSKIFQKYHGTMSKNMVHFCKRRQIYFLFPRTINTHFLILSLSNRPLLQTHKQTHT